MSSPVSIPRNRAILAVIVVFATCVVGATAAWQQTAPGPTFKEVGRWGKAGTANGQFQGNAYGLATDKAGKVYVADTDNHRIQVFTSKGGFVRAMTFGPDASVQDVAVDPAGNAWGTDLQAKQARQFAANGQAGATVTTPKAAVGIGVDAQGNVYVSTNGDGISSVVRYDKTAGGWQQGKTWGGFQEAGDVEVSADGSVYVADVRGAPPTVKRFDGNGKLLKTIKTQLPATGGAGAGLAIAVDLDCNIWMTNVPQRNLVKYSPAGTILGTAASADLIAQDVAVGPTGDLYAYDSGTKSIVHFAEDRSKPQAASVAGVGVTKKGAGHVARLKYTLTGVACPAQVDATASLAGKGIVGKATVKVAAGKTTVIEIPLAQAALAKVAGTSAGATFTIVLKTNGRPTTQTGPVNLSVPANAK